MKRWLRRELERIISSYEAPQAAAKRVRRTLKEKREVVEEIKGLLSSYRTIVVLDGTGVSANFLSYMRSKLQGIAVVKVYKNSLLAIALRELGYRGAEEVAKYLQGQNIFAFTNLNPFEIASAITKISMPTKAKPGDVLDNEIVVPPMRTSIRPGPLMSLFGKLKIPIQVKDGVVWIAKEATIAKPGTVVTPELASLFNALDIEPRLVKARIKAAYEGGVVIPGEKLTLDLEAYRKEFIEASQAALNLASELAIPEAPVVTISILKAYAKAVRLATEACFPTRESLAHMAATAMSRALALAVVVSEKAPDLVQGVPLPQVAQAPQQRQEGTTSSPTAEREKGEEEKRREVSEEQLAEGLAALFG